MEDRDRGPPDEDGRCQEPEEQGTRQMVASTGSQSNGDIPNGTP
jgi:hypothetical protein